MEVAPLGKGCGGHLRVLSTIGIFGMMLMVWTFQSNTLVSPYLAFVVPQPGLGYVSTCMWSACCLSSLAFWAGGQNVCRMHVPYTLTTKLFIHTSRDH